MSLDHEAQASGGVFSEASAPPFTSRPTRSALDAALQQTTLKWAFTGFWEGTRDLAPFGDPSWTILGCNHGFPYLKGGPESWGVWIDIHDPAWSASHLKPEVWADMERFLKMRHGRPIFMQKHYPEYPDSIAFPLTEVEAKFPVTQNRNFRRYNTNALTYVISLALLRGVTDLAIYGADMRGDEEYGAQRPAVEYWLGRAEGMGVRVTVPAESGLLNADGMDYGYDHATSAWIEMRRLLEDERARLLAEKDKALAAAQSYDGAWQTAGDLIRRVDQRRRGGGAL